MTEEMRKDENIFIIGEDIGIYGGTFGVTTVSYTHLDVYKRQALLLMVGYLIYVKQVL